MIRQVLGRPGLGFAVVAMAIASAPGVCHAANVVWNGGTGVWNVGANWVGGTAPGSSDVAQFSGSTTACSITSSVAVAGITISVPVTITQSTGVTITSTGAFAQSAGTFAGGNSTIIIGGAFNLSGGTFTSTSGLLEVSGAFNQTAGTFTHNSGRVILNATSSQTFGSNGSTFNTLAISDGLAGYWKLTRRPAPARRTHRDMATRGRSPTVRPGRRPTCPRSVSPTPPRSASTEATTTSTFPLRSPPRRPPTRCARGCT